MPAARRPIRTQRWTPEPTSQRPWRSKQMPGRRSSSGSPKICMALAGSSRADESPRRQRATPCAGYGDARSLRVCTRSGPPRSQCKDLRNHGVGSHALPTPTGRVTPCPLSPAPGIPAPPLAAGAKIRRTSSDPGRTLLTGFVGGAAPTDDWEKLTSPRFAASATPLRISTTTAQRRSKRWSITTSNSSSASRRIPRPGSCRRWRPATACISIGSLPRKNAQRWSPTCVP